MYLILLFLGLLQFRSNLISNLGLYYIASEINLCYSSYVHFINVIYFVLVVEGPSWKSVFLVCKWI